MALDDFLIKLCQLPRMMHNPDLLTFLGILDGKWRPVGDTSDGAKPARIQSRTPTWAIARAY